MRLEELREAYRSTWLDWTRKTGELQLLADRAGKGGGNSDSAALEKALLAVECARTAHNEARDRLARGLGNTASLPYVPSVQSGPDDGRVRETAHMLWEFSGQPDGTAESDWQRAQAVVRTAGACGD